MKRDRKERAKEPAEKEDQGEFWSFVTKAVQETKQRLPHISSDAMRFTMALRRATDIIFYDLHASLGNRGNLSSAAALRVLLVLSVTGPTELRNIARLAGMSRASVSALVESLHRSGLIERVPSKTDRRTIVVSLTKAGNDAFQADFSAYNEKEQIWLSTLSAEEQKLLIHLLEKMISTRLGDPELNRRK